MNFIRDLVKQYTNFRSWKTNKKILIIESDDWGSQRTPDISALKSLLDLDPSLSNDCYTCYDSIASSDDLSFLYEVLDAYRDINGNPCVITANVCVANPDFKKIKEDNFEKFHYEEFDATIMRYPDGAKILKLWKTGMDRGLFKPQLHGREHVHALSWLEELRLGNSKLLKAFDYGVWGIPFSSISRQRRRNLMAALDIYGFKEEEAFQNQWITDASQIFERHFGYSSLSFIPPAYIWNRRILNALQHSGVKAIQGILLQYEPIMNAGQGYKKNLHFTGSKFKNGIVKIARNAFFEPSIYPELNSVDDCLNKMDYAFKHNQPAIIGSHRINFIGSLSVKNRDKNLVQLKRLLETSLRTWPEIEFCSTDQLVQLMQK